MTAVNGRISLADGQNGVQSGFVSGIQLFNHIGHKHNLTLPILHFLGDILVTLPVAFMADIGVEIGGNIAAQITEI